MQGGKKNSSHPKYTFPPEAKQQSLTFLFSFQAVTKHPFRSFLSPTFFIILCFSLVISLFKIIPQHGVKVLPHALKHKKTMMYHREKMGKLNKLPSGMSYNVIGLGVNVNESIMQYVQEKGR